MKTRTLIRYLGTTVMLGAMLMPLSSQADVYWSLNLGQGLQHDKARHYRHRDHDNRHAGRHHRRHKLHRYYWRHRARHHAYYYPPYAYRFIPRQRPHYRGHH